MWLLLAHGARNRNRTLVISISFSLSNAQIFSQICSQFLTNWLSLFRGPGKTFRVEMQNIFFCKLEPHHALNVSRHFPASGTLLAQSHVAKMPSSSTDTQGSSLSHLLREALYHLQTRCNLSTAPSSAPHLWQWSFSLLYHLLHFTSLSLLSVSEPY